RGHRAHARLHSRASRGRSRRRPGRGRGVMRAGWTRRRGIATAVATLTAAALITTIAPAAWAPPGPPSGIAPFAEDQAVSLAWSPSAGASSYTVLRGTSEGNVTAALTTT